MIGEREVDFLKDWKHPISQLYMIILETQNCIELIG